MDCKVTTSYLNSDILTYFLIVKTNGNLLFVKCKSEMCFVLIVFLREMMQFCYK